MASPQEKDGADDITNPVYPEQVFVNGDPEVADPGLTQPEPEYVTSKKLKDEEEKGGNENKDGLHKLKSTLVISGLVVAVIGAIFAVAKKIKEA